MSETVFTMTGKTGDALMQWPVAYHWSKVTGKKFTIWMDEASCKMLKPLFEAQPCCEKVEFKTGVENWSCGGQPWHFNLKTEDCVDRTVYHLGYRRFPVRQLTLESLEGAKLPVEIDRDKLASEPSIFVDATPANRAILHGNPVCPHNRQTPQFWKFLAIIYPYLLASFDEIVFVGSERDREMGTRTYPSCSEFDDGGDYLKLAELIAGSRLMVGCGSAPIVLASLLKIPSVRVHDPIGGHPKTIWSNLSPNSINDTEVDLRGTWPEFRDKWLTVAANV